jgi:hypothetical protein
VISRGRLIRSTSQLPVLVQNGVSNAKAALEKKFGAAIILNIYEMMDGNCTDYYVTLDNQKVNSVYAVSPQGSFVRMSRDKKNLPEVVSPEMIAKKN